jgi:hypothetical protein
MPKLTETFAKKLPHSKAGSDKYWDAEIKGLVLFVGKRSKTWYFQKDVGGQTKRILIGRFPIISAQAARQTALEFALEMGRGAGKAAQLGASRGTCSHGWRPDGLGKRNGKRPGVGREPH